MSATLSEIQALEKELHLPGVRCDAARLNELLHAEFHEVGRSGTEYDRESVILLLVRQEHSPVVVSSNFSLCHLAVDACLLTYCSAHCGNDGALENHTLRSSVWVKVGALWQLRYHQGTPAAQAW